MLSFHEVKVYAKIGKCVCLYRLFIEYDIFGGGSRIFNQSEARK